MGENYFLWGITFPFLHRHPTADRGQVQGQCGGERGQQGDPGPLRRHEQAAHCRLWRAVPQRDAHRLGPRVSKARLRGALQRWVLRRERRTCGARRGEEEQRQGVVSHEDFLGYLSWWQEHKYCCCVRLNLHEHIAPQIKKRIMNDHLLEAYSLTGSVWLLAIRKMCV